MRVMLPTIVAACAGCAASVLANPTAIIQTTGVGANAFADGLRFSSIDRPTKSGTGDYWVLLARNNTGTATDAMVITGQGLAYNLAAQEGVSTFGGRVFSTSDRYMDINASGDWVAIGNHADGASTDDEAVYAGDFLGLSLSLAAFEGQTSGAGPVLGTGNHGPGITDAGAYSFGYSRTTNANEINYYTSNGATIVIDHGDVPTGQRGGTSLAFSTVPFSGRNAFQVTSDGSSYLVGGELSNGDSVMVKDGAVVLQEGNTIYGGETLATFLHEQNLLQDNGDWYQRGTTNTDRGLAIRNGAVIAAGGELVGGNLVGERWSDSVWTSSSGTTFFQVTGDSQGNFVVGGFTDNAPGANAVWMYNGLFEILRAGDQVDLDGDGLLDDAFVYDSSLSTASPSQLGGFLADDGWFYTLVDIRNGAGADLGEAFIQVAVPAPGALAALGLFGVMGARRRR